MFTIKLTFNSENYTIPITYERCRKLMNQLPKDIREQIFSQYYIVESDVKKDSFDNFIKYLKDSVYPAINFNNMLDFHLLSQEFGILTEYLSDKIDKESLNLSILCLDAIKDKSKSESYVSTHLDDIIENHAKELLEASIASLFNIFYHRERVFKNHQKAYDLIIRASSINSDKNSSLFILLESLDGVKLDEKSKIESLKKKNERFQFCPKLDKSFMIDINKINALKGENQQIIKEKSDLQKKNQQLKK